MAIRRPLQNKIFLAWQRAIHRDYCNQRINSERSLQASFWTQLNRTLPAKTRRMFLEPCMTVGGNQRFYPDIVICNTMQVIAVVEIKYQPRALPSHDKDLDTLRVLAKNRKRLSVSNARFRGPTADAKVYPLSDDVLFVWAGVHKTPTSSFESQDCPMLSKGRRVLHGCFLQLHAETDHLNKPKFFSRSN